MDELAQRHKVAAFKTYTQWGPDGKGFWLDDEPGLAMIEKARKLGVKKIAVHKGLPFGQKSYEHSTCRDVGRVAKRFPDVMFLIYHSGFVPRAEEGPYDAKRTDGIDALVTSLAENGIAPNSNVYRGAGLDVAALHAQPGHCGPHDRQARQGVRRVERALGHGLHLVRLAAGPDPGFPDVPDLARTARAARLSGNDSCTAREDFRPERARRFTRCPPTCCNGTCARTGWRENAPSIARSDPIRPSRPTDRRRGGEFLNLRSREA